MQIGHFFKFFGDIVEINKEAFYRSLSIFKICYCYKPEIAFSFLNKFQRAVYQLLKDQITSKSWTMFEIHLHHIQVKDLLQCILESTILACQVCLIHMVTIAMSFKVFPVTKFIAKLVEQIVSIIISMFNTQKYVQAMSFSILHLETFTIFNSMDTKVSRKLI